MDRCRKAAFVLGLMAILACAALKASISAPYLLAGDPSSKAANATPSPTQGSSAEKKVENVRYLLRRKASDTGSGKKPSLIFP